MPSSLEIQFTREVCTTVSPAADNDDNMSTSSAAAAVLAFPPQARHPAHPSVPSTPPPAYEGSSIGHLHDNNDSSNPATRPPPPDYTKFTETTRAERCFYYGFLL